MAQLGTCSSEVAAVEKHLILSLAWPYALLYSWWCFHGGRNFLAQEQILGVLYVDSRHQKCLASEKWAVSWARTR